MNWSMITCARVGEVAELRLPQHERLGRLRRVAVLEAEARDLATAASCAARSAPARPARFWIGQSVWPVLASCRTMWRWENVPRSASWPVRRIGVPSVSSEAKASASACAQSMPPSVAERLAPALELLDELRVDVKPSGTCSSSSLSARSRSAATAVLTSGDGERSSWYSPVGCSTSPASSAALICALSVWCSACRSSQTSCCWRSTSSWRDDAVARRAARRRARDALRALDLRVHLGLRVGGLVGLVVAEAAVADQVDDDVVAELLRGRRSARRTAVMQAATSSALTWMIGTSKPLARSEAHRVERRVLGVGREADLVVLDQVDACRRPCSRRAPGGSASPPRRPGPGTRRRRAGRSGRAASVSRWACGPWRVVCAARVAPTTTGCDVLEVRRVATRG